MKSESPVAIPFSITPDAEDYLRNCLDEMPPETHPWLMMTSWQTDGLNPPRWYYQGPSFIICCFDDSEKPKMEYTESELLGRRVAIETSALKQLSGQTLELRRVASSRGLANITRYVLVANSVPEARTIHNNAFFSPEQAKRLFAIAALTILGGFTGMGVVGLSSPWSPC